MTLSAAASMAGIDPIKITQLPDTNGIKSEILVPKKRMDEVKGYDRTITASGAKLVEFGSESAVTVEDLESAKQFKYCCNLLFLASLWCTTIGDVQLATTSRRS
ncbi:MAG: hypothetical protein CM1200mP7_2980 [Chloroflexota bacterium]|nr:MAG: hypothetical protein CM1200mP7_2980 [Chloroflexota bacterium]